MWIKNKYSLSYRTLYETLTSALFKRWAVSEKGCRHASADVPQKKLRMMIWSLVSSQLSNLESIIVFYVRDLIAAQLGISSQSCNPLGKLILDDIRASIIVLCSKKHCNNFLFFQHLKVQRHEKLRAGNLKVFAWIS